MALCSVLKLTGTTFISFVPSPNFSSVPGNLS
jgi:hypothetical protein